MSVQAPRLLRRSGAALAAVLLGWGIAPPAAAATVTVTTSADSGPGSLRDAIEQANADGEPTLILFDAAVAGQTIFLASPLPGLAEPDTTLDGDHGGDCSPDVGLDGGGTVDQGLVLGGTGATVRGLAVSGFVFQGISIPGDGNAVECGRIANNGGNGVEIHSSTGNRVGPGNLIADNGGHGVQVNEGSLPGFPDFPALVPDFTGVFQLVDFTDDCAAFHSADAITPLDGGGLPFTENFGLRLTGTLTLDAAGSWQLALPGLDDQGRIVVDGGVVLEWFGGGTPPPAVVALGAGAHTFEVDFMEHGGAARLELEISGPGTATLATDPAGPCATSQPGLCGELFQLRVPSSGHRVTENRIRDNGGLGIALNCCCGPVPNDPGDADVGSNGLLNHPEPAALAAAGGGSYTLSGTAPPDSTVEVFLVDPDPSGAGEGAELLASTVAGPGGAFAATFPLAGGFGELTATATAAAPDLSTSEFSPNFAFGVAADELNLGSPGSFLPGTTFSVPVRVRDLSLTPLGVDRPAGERIQALVVRVTYAPAAAVAAIAFSRAGLTLPLAPLFETTVGTADTVSWVVSFDETTDPIPFTLDAPFPGDLVASLEVTLAAGAPPGPVTLTVDRGVSELGNQAGTLAENDGAGTLFVGDGGFEVRSNAAANPYAEARSTSEIALSWDDPQENETGFRVERSPDGASWAPVATVGPYDTSFLDGGLAASTLYYYRLVTLIAAGDSQPSPTAAATTFAAAAALVCAAPIDGDLSWARFPKAAFDGGGWGVAWEERLPGGAGDEIVFQRLEQATAQPAGPPLAMTDTDSLSALATLRWNGSRYGLLRVESMRREPGEVEDSTKLFFSLFEADGTPVRRDVRPFADTLRAFGTSTRDLALVWDGTHWSFVNADVFDEPFTDLVFARLTELGDPVLGPLRLTADLRYKLETSADWSPAESKLGVAYVDALDGGWDVYFRRLEESTGAAEPAVHLFHSDSYFGFFGTDVAWTGSGWAVAWTETTADFSESRIWLSLLAADGTPLGPPERLSDDAGPGVVVDDNLPSIENRTGGGFVVLASSLDEATSNYEISRLQADAAGARDGTREQLTPSDARNSIWHRTASDGAQILVVYNDAGPGSLEIAALLTDAAGMAAPAPPVGLTGGHSPGNSLSLISHFGQQVVPLGAGFGVVWVDVSTQPATLHARFVDGTGAVVAAPAPLTPRPTAGAPGVVGVGDELAVAWRHGGAVVFQRFDVAGNPLTGESELSTAAGGRPEVALGFDGEAYAALWHQAGSMTFRRVAPDGTPLGPALPVFGPFGGPGPRLRWTGFGWAVLFRQGDDLRYGLLDRQGGVLAGPVTLTSSTVPAAPINSFDLAFDGAGVGVAWSELRGPFDPPGREIYFTVLDRAGGKLFPEVVVVGTPLDDLHPALAWDPAIGRYRLVHAEGASGAVREIEVAPDGTVTPGGRYLTNRAGPVSTAWNGATLAVAWRELNRVHFATTACLDDPSPPPCPDLAVTSAGGNVQLSWPAVDDPESGIRRYEVVRDGALLAESFAGNTAFADRGYGFGTTHLYQVRAMNGAFRESTGCPAVAFSTLAGDANGNGTLEVADIFYLINFLLAGGPPPAGDADANGDGAVTVSDVFFLINFFFGGGPAPVWSGQIRPTAAAAGGAP